MPWKPQRVGPLAIDAKLPINKSPRAIRFQDPMIRSALTGLTLLLGLKVSSGAEPPSAPTDLPPSKDLAVETVAVDLSNPMEMSIAGDLVFIAELHGNIKVVDLTTGVTRVVAHLEVDYRKKGPRWDWDVESGVLGIAVDPDFERNHWVYVCYTRPGGESRLHHHVVSRFRYQGGLLNKASEEVILTIPALRDQARIHEAGSLAFGPDGTLYISSGDNQDHTQYLYSARTSTNSADLKGKILRVRPAAGGGYTIPPGNLFVVGQADTRPEIYVMGCRNPFRLSVDPKTGFLYWGENGPADHYCGSLQNVDQALLPLGYDEFNQARQAGFFGWPFFIGPNECYPTYDFARGAVTGAVAPQQPINDLKENTGVRELPPAQEPMIWYSHPPSPDFPSLGQGGASAIAGPVFYHDDSVESAAGGLPKAFDHHWFIADYARGWVKMVELDDNENRVAIKAFPSDYRFETPINLKFNRVGQLFVLQYGRGGWDADNGGSLVRISHRLDGGLAGHQVVASRPLQGLPSDHPGTALIRQNNCIACHATTGELLGPSFEMITEKYPDPATREAYLQDRIRRGGKGVWGEIHQMPPHPHLEKEQVAQIVEAIFALRLVRHEARGHSVSLETPPSPRYTGAGGAELVDGMSGDANDLRNDWLGFEGEDLMATIDLGETISINEVGLATCQATKAGVFLPPIVVFETSSDGEIYQEVARIENDVPLDKPIALATLAARINLVQARYLRVRARNLGSIPDWHPAKGREAWLFVSEILVNPRHWK